MVKKIFIPRNEDNITIVFGDDGVIEVSGMAEKEPGHTNISKNIWRAYRNFHSGDQVIRSGFGLCGAYGYDPKSPKVEGLPEVDTIHASSAEEIAINIFRFYPDLFTNEEQRKIALFLRYHDYGEGLSGDKPDDGSFDKDEKFEEELGWFIKMVECLPAKVQKTLIVFFFYFEHGNNQLLRYSANKSGRSDFSIAQFAKLCDKTDAILRSILYESQDTPIDLSFKVEHYGGITARDQENCDLTGTTAVPDVWTVGFLKNYHDFEYFPIFLDLIRQAILSTRGEFFPWFEKAKKMFDIKDSDLDIIRYEGAD